MITVYKTPIARQLPIYKKAIEVYTLSRNITGIIAPEKTIVDLHTSNKVTENYLDKLVVGALSIPPKIAIAQSTKDTRTRLQTIDTVAALIEHLRQYCHSLSDLKITHNNSLKTLRKELRLLKKMHRQWSVVLTQQN